MELKEYFDYRSKHEILVQPMTQKELADNVRKDGNVQAKVLVEFNNLVGGNWDNLNDEVSEKITGSIAGLTDISFTVAGRTTNNELILKVTGVPELDD